MLVLGCDPGPSDYSWALYNEDDHGRGVVDWGTCPIDAWPQCEAFKKCKVVGIERIQTYGHPLDNRTLLVCENVGRIQKMMEYMSRKVYLIPRKSIAVRLAASVKAGDKEINAAVNQFIPEMKVKRKGVDSHVRAALAVAIVTYGMHQSQETMRFAG